MNLRDKKVLFIGGVEAVYDRLKEIAAQAGDNGFSLQWCASVEDGLQACMANTSDLFLVHESVDNRRGMGFAISAFSSGCKNPVILLSDTWNDDLEIRVQNSQVADYYAIDVLDVRILMHIVGAAIEREKKIDRLQQEQYLLEALLDNIPDTIYFKDRESRFTRVNKAQAKVLGVKSPVEAIGKTDFDFFEHAKEAYADEQAIMKTGRPLIDKQEKVKWANGDYRYMSATKVPIVTQKGEIVGTLGLSRDITDRVTAEKELEVVKEHLEEAMVKINEELVMAQQIQKSLLPEEFPVISGLRYSVAYNPCSAVGGDLYDAIKYDDTRLGLLLFDVVGHGVPAALVATMAKMIFNKHMARGISPEKVLTSANEEIITHFKGKRHLAAFYGIIDTTSRTMIFAKGGLPPALIIRKDGTVNHLTAQGVFVGLFTSSTYNDNTVQLEMGDRLIMFTDGLIEAFDDQGKFFGIKRLEEAALEVRDYPLDVMVSAIINAKKRFSKDTQRVDDVTVIAIEVI